MSFLQFVRSMRFRWDAARHAVHVQKMTASIAGLPKGTDGKLAEPHATRLSHAVWYGQELQGAATAVGVQPHQPPAPAPHPFPTPPATPNWLGWIQTALLVGVLAFVAPTHFQGCSIPWPHPTPPAPVPVDPFVSALQAAYDADPATASLCDEGNKAASLALLQQVWAQASTVAADTSLKTVGDLYAKLHTAANAILADKLTGVRKVIEANANKNLPTNPAQALDAPTRAQCQQEFSRVATALKRVKP